MINTHRILLAVCFACFLPLKAFSEAPVVDDSENFALLDEQQQAPSEEPFVRSQSNVPHDDEEPAFANDSRNSTNGRSDNAALLDKIQGMQQEIQELRGQLEVQAHDLKLLQEQQLAFYKDLDGRLRGQPATPVKKEPSTDLSIDANTTPQKPIDAPPPAMKPQQNTLITPTINNAARNNPADEQVSYLAAYELVKNKQFDEALIAMQTFVTQHPQGGYTANAQYWLGELYMVKKDYPKAIEHFEVVLQQFPSSSKSAASMLKIGYALAASGRKNEAIQYLQKVVKNYPDTNTANLAAAKLETLNN